MLFVVDRRPTHSFAKEQKSASPDVPGPSVWHFPYMTVGVSMTIVTPDMNGYLLPEKPLTRADVATLLTRYWQYRSGKRLAYAKTEIRTETKFALASFAQGHREQAAQASFRAILLSAGALEIKPDDAETRSLQKMAWGVGKIMIGKESEAEPLFQEAERLVPGIAPRSTIISPP
jgi:hypothetical protein